MVVVEAFVDIVFVGEPVGCRCGVVLGCVVCGVVLLRLLVRVLRDEWLGVMVVLDLLFVVVR